MPSTNKTTNLSLNQWVESDRPMRNDFNSDNTIIDSVVGTHVANSSIHVTADEKARIGTPYLTNMYAGTGEGTKSISLSEKVRFVVVYAEDMPLSVYDSTSGKTKSYAAVGYTTLGGSSGLAIGGSGKSITVYQGEDENGNKTCLNELGVQYKVVMFK